MAPGGLIGDGGGKVKRHWVGQVRDVEGLAGFVQQPADQHVLVFVDDRARELLAHQRCCGVVGQGVELAAWVGEGAVALEFAADEEVWLAGGDRGSGSRSSSSRTSGV